VLVTLVKPNTAYEGICIEHLEPFDQVDFIDEFNLIQEDYFNKLNKLYETHDLKHDYRRFLAERMSDIVTEEI
jgi:hypothetical protein